MALKRAGVARAGPHFPRSLVVMFHLCFLAAASLDSTFTKTAGLDQTGPPERRHKHGHAVAGSELGSASCSSTEMCASVVLETSASQKLNSTTRPHPKTCASLGCIFCQCHPKPDTSHHPGLVSLHVGGWHKMMPDQGFSWKRILLEKDSSPRPFPPHVSPDHTVVLGAAVEMTCRWSFAAQPKFSTAWHPRHGIHGMASSFSGRAEGR